MKLVRISILILVVGFATTAILGSTTVDGSHVALEGARPPMPLSGGASSVDELLGRFLRALEASDRTALEALRVGEVEYRKLIMPGSAKPGEPPQKLSPAADQYFWESLDTKSVYSAQFLLAHFGGRKYRIKDVVWQKGVDDYLWYRCYDRLEMTLVDDAGAEHVLNTGSVAEVGGRFKFISFIRD